jgi:predicted phage terminase large subunit-like protein
VKKEDVEKALQDLLGERDLAEEAEHLSSSFVAFVKGAWPSLEPDVEYKHNWHIEAICEYLEAVSRSELFRLQIWIPPGSMKTSLVSILWPAWEWTFKPNLRYWTASYETRFAMRNGAKSRDLMRKSWYQERFGEKFQIERDAEHYFTNNRGGTRLSTSPESTGTGEHGHRIIIDDPIDARSADAISKTKLNDTNEWYDNTVSSRAVPGFREARILVMQRLHESDFAAHLLEAGEWEILCLPERRWDHPFAWSRDPRPENELLWPEGRSEDESNELAGRLRHRAAGQLQQWPAPREGRLLKRNWWRFYDPAVLTDVKRKPRFTAVVQSVDTPLKDKESNDLVAIQAWGVLGADRYLLDLRKGHMNYLQAKRAIKDQANYVRKLFPRIAHYCLIENAGYGVELIIDLKREMTGVVKIGRGQDGDKVMRAEAASSDLESGNCFLPGRRVSQDELSLPDESATGADIIDFINSLALFPNAEHDDDVDAWSQAMNWLRSRVIRPGRTSSPYKRRRVAA